MRKILVIGEHTKGKLSSIGKVLAAAKDIGGDCDVALFGENISTAGEVARYDGVCTVFSIERPENAYPIAALLAPQIVLLAQNDYSHVLFPGNSFGKDLAPRVAALLDVQPISDIMTVHGPAEFDRPIYAGNVIIRIAANTEPLIVATVRLASFNAVGTSNSSAMLEKKFLNISLPTHTHFIRLDEQKSGRPDLQSAQTVVCGGRALGSSKSFELIFQLADKLGAGVGGSRAAVDSGYVANDLQVGQTGQIIAPGLYFAIGISGAIQHLAGIKDAGVIVAINNNPEAPIFEVADYGLVGDLFKIVPELIEKL